MHGSRISTVALPVGHLFNNLLWRERCGSRNPWMGGQVPEGTSVGRVEYKHAVEEVKKVGGQLELQDVPISPEFMIRQTLGDCSTQTIW